MLLVAAWWSACLISCTELPVAALHGRLQRVDRAARALQVRAPVQLRGESPCSAVASVCLKLVYIFFSMFL